jgi:hypothetical protein
MEDLHPDLNEVIKSSSVLVLPQKYAVLSVKRLPNLKDVFAVMRDENEITVVIEEKKVGKQKAYKTEIGFRLIQVAVSVPFYTVGFLASVTGAISQKNVNVLVISTFSKDYLLIRDNHIELALDALRNLGFVVKTYKSKVLGLF